MLLQANFNSILIQSRKGKKSRKTTNFVQVLKYNIHQERSPSFSKTQSINRMLTFCYRPKEIFCWGKRTVYTIGGVFAIGTWWNSSKVVGNFFILFTTGT
uniref:Uncharacterized protein n=1 Tax=Cacopsylla melanoneura TaxID=428564 RepID=A0A8D8WD15_9HEMI